MISRQNAHLRDEEKRGKSPWENRIASPMTANSSRAQYVRHAHIGAMVELEVNFFPRIQGLKLSSGRFLRRKVPEYQRYGFKHMNGREVENMTESSKVNGAWSQRLSSASHHHVSPGS
jgi:hypothetical protein